MPIFRGIEQFYFDIRRKHAEILDIVRSFDDLDRIDIVGQDMRHGRIHPVGARTVNFHTVYCDVDVVFFLPPHDDVVGNTGTTHQCHARQLFKKRFRHIGGLDLVTVYVFNRFVIDGLLHIDGAYIRFFRIER